MRKIKHDLEAKGWYIYLGKFEYSQEMLIIPFVIKASLRKALPGIKKIVDGRADTKLISVGGFNAIVIAK
jgi:hypothetical protein